MKIHSFSVNYPDGFVLSAEENEIKAGKIYALVGANGSGKSSYLKALAGILKTSDGSRPLSEEISVTYQPQKPYAFRGSVLSNVLLTNRDPARAAELLHALGIESLASRKSQRLSGGETARMVLARSLMCGCDILLLDEPAASMDMESTILAEKAIVSTCRRTGCAVLFVTHSLAQAERIADEIFFFQKGKILERGDTRQFLTAPAKEETRNFLEFSNF